MKIRTILIDDERKALAILQNKIERLCTEVEIVAATQNPIEGISLINNLQPQLVFLDVAMPEVSGFDILTQIKNPNFEIIFATAFDNYAIEAIKHCAIGYLVKPVDNNDLVVTVNKAIANILDKTALEKNKILIENLGVQTFQKKKVIVPTQEGLEFITISTIIRCEGTDGYTTIYLSGGSKHLSSQSVGHFVKMLSGSSFYQVHKSHLINLDYLDRYLNEGYVILDENHNVPVSRNRRVEFLNKIKESA